MPEITAKQMRFVDEYLVDCNGTQAAIRAGYSKRTANEQAARLLAKVSIRREIQARQVKLAEASQVTAEMVIGGLLKEAQREDDEASHAARVAAWTQLAKHLGLFEQDNKQRRPDVISELLNSLAPEDQIALRAFLQAADGVRHDRGRTAGKPTAH